MLALLEGQNWYLESKHCHSSGVVVGVCVKDRVDFVQQTTVQIVLCDASCSLFHLSFSDLCFDILV